MTASQDPLWLALSPARRDELLEKHRDANVQFDWWDSTYEQFIEKLKEIGIEVDTRPRRTSKGKIYYDPEIYFSGFWCQGDGACFAGRVRDWTLLLTAMDEKRFIETATEIGWSFRCTANGRYSNSGTMDFEGEMYVPENPFDEDRDLLQHEAWKVGRLTESDTDGLFDRLKEKFRSLADQLYADLEAEHDYLTSDEQVVEFILNHALDELTEDEEEDEEAAIV